jgi:hypothetical protein
LNFKRKGLLVSTNSSRKENYKLQAALMRKLAEEAQFPEICTAYRMLAEKWDALAEFQPATAFGPSDSGDVDVEAQED